MTQTETLFEYLSQGHTITVAEALNELGIYALSQRVGDLKRKGVDIQSHWEKHNGKHYKRYYLADAGNVSTAERRAG